MTTRETAQRLADALDVYCRSNPPTYIEQAASLLRQWPEAGWMPIESAPKDVKAHFWLAPRPPEKCFRDTSGNPMYFGGEPYAVFDFYGRWSVLYEAQCWHPGPAAPGAAPSQQPAPDLIPPEALFACGQAGGAQVTRVRVEQAAPSGMVMVPRDLLRRLIQEALTFDPTSQDKDAIEQAKRLAADPQAVPRRVRKIGGSFQHSGTVVAEFTTTAGEPRIVLEFDAPVAGMLHVYRPDQVEPALDAPQAVPQPEPDWLHLKRYGYAPGNYMNRCHACEAMFSDLDKRASTCRPCAEQLHARAHGITAKGEQP